MSTPKPLFSVSSLLPASARPMVTGAPGPRPPSAHLASQPINTPTIKKETIMSQKATGAQEKIVNALNVSSGGMSDDELIKATGITGRAFQNAIYNAKKKGWIKRNGDLIELDNGGEKTAGKKAVAITPKPASTFAHRLKIESTAGVDLLAKAKKFIPCGPGAPAAIPSSAFHHAPRAVNKAEGGTLLIEGNVVLIELSAAQVNAIISAQVTG